MKEKIELGKGSGNVFRNFNYPNADVEQLKDAHLERFTVDWLMTIINRLNYRVDVKVSVKVISCSNAA